MVPWKGTSVNLGLVGSRAPGGASKSSSSLVPGLTWALITEQCLGAASSAGLCGLGFTIDRGPRKKGSLGGLLQVGKPCPAAWQA